MNEWGEPWRKEQEEKRERRKTILFIVILIISMFALIFLGWFIKIILFPVHVAEQSFDTTYGVVDKVMDADNAIYNYEWFKEQEALIRTCLKNEEIAKEEWDNYLAVLPNEREKWTREDKEEESSLRNSYYALQKLTNRTIEDYNAKSSMVSRNVFKDNLPSNIARSWYSGKELTK